MKTGDIVRDDQGRAYQIGQLISRDLWSKTYAAREDNGGPELSLKLPLNKHDLPSGLTHLIPVCRDAILEEAALRSDRRLQGIAPVVSQATLPGGVPGLLIARTADTLERRLSAGISLKELLGHALQITNAVMQISEVHELHGNLQPKDIIFTERGEFLLPSPLPKTVRGHLSELRTASGMHDPYLPPEFQPGSTDALPRPVLDTYAIAAIVYWGALASTEGPTRPPDTPLAGLDKSMLVALKDQVHNRLKAEKANPRFHTRLSDRTASLLNRALSHATSPSPPYRFLRMREFHQRLEHLQALIHPRVEHVGKVLLDRPPGSDTYNTDEDVVFSCTIGCSTGVENHEEIVCGWAIFDRDTNERIRNVECIYTVDPHPSGRLRFGFRIPNMIPGSFLVRVVFKIRDSGDEPKVSEGRFECRAAPGYIPPPADPAPKRPIPMQRTEDEGTAAVNVQPSPPPTNTAPPIASQQPPSVRTTAPPPIAKPAVAAPPPTARVSAQPQMERTQPPPSNRRIIHPPHDANQHHAAQQGAAAQVTATPSPSVSPSTQPPPRTGRATIHSLPPPAHDTFPPLNTRARGFETEPDSDPFANETTAPQAAVPPIRTRPIQTPSMPPPVEDDPYDFPVENRGTWEPELPAPDLGRNDLYDPPDDDDDDWSDEEYPVANPVGELLGKVVDLVRGDAYVMFIGGAAVVIMVLIGLLLAIR